MMEIWQFMNRIAADCRKYGVTIRITSRGNDCVYIELICGDISYEHEIRWNFMKKGVYDLFDEIEKELTEMKRTKAEFRDKFF